MTGWGLIVVIALAAFAGYALVLAVREFIKGAGEAVLEHAQASSLRGRPESDRPHRAGDGGYRHTERDEPVLRPSGLGWHEVLGISKTATLGEVKLAYRQMIALYHPDRVSGLGDEFRILAERRAKEINAAYAAARRFFPTSQD